MKICQSDPRLFPKMGKPLPFFFFFLSFLQKPCGASAWNLDQKTNGGFGEAPGVLMFVRWMKGSGARQMDGWRAGDRSPTPQTVGGGG